MFPIGNMMKSEVREMAGKLRLPNHDRKDSQGICFLGKVNYDDFLKDHLGEHPGDVVDFESGQVIGAHRGLWYHTIGQRRGIVPTLANAYRALGPWHVVQKDIPSNTIYVSRQYASMR